MDHMRILHRITVKFLYTLYGFSIINLYQTEETLKLIVFVLLFSVSQTLLSMELFMETSVLGSISLARSC
jgi:hypothetical protein